MTINFSHFCEIYSGSGHPDSYRDLQPGQLYLSPDPIAIGIAKIAPWWLARRDSFSAKVPRDTSSDGATNAFCSYPLAAVSSNKSRCNGTTSLTYVVSLR
jgi:hypothetical protein